MRRALCLVAALVAAWSAAAMAQSRYRGFDRWDVRGFDRPDACGGWSDLSTFCDTRDLTMAAPSLLDIDAGQNGSIRVRGSDRRDVQVRVRIGGYADTSREAEELAKSVRIDSADGRLRADGPSSERYRHWRVSFEVELPRKARVSMTTYNGSIAIEDFAGEANFRARNGGVSLSRVSGDIRGRTENGGLSIDLSGDRWDGAGLDVETRNGGVRMLVPERYSAELETGTVNGGIEIDFPVMVQGRIGRQITATLGSGGPRIRALTRNGGITIRKQ